MWKGDSGSTGGFDGSGGGVWRDKVGLVHLWEGIDGSVVGGVCPLWGGRGQGAKNSPFSLGGLGGNSTTLPWGWGKCLGFASPGSVVVNT